MLIDYFSSIPVDYNDALNHLINFYSSKTNSGKACKELFNLLRHSPIGLREIDIFKLMSEEFTTLELYQIIDVFRHFVKYEKEMGLISLRHPSNRIVSYITYNKIYDYIQDLPSGNEFKQMFMMSDIDDSFIPAPEEFNEHFSRAMIYIYRYKYDEALSIIDWLLENVTSESDIDINQLLITRMNILAYKDNIVDSAYLLNVIIKKLVCQENVYTELEASIDAYRKDDLEEAFSCGILMNECIESIFKTTPFCKYIYYTYIADILYLSKDFKASLEYRKMAIDMLKSMSVGIEACYAYSYIKHSLACYYIKVSEGFHAYDYEDELNYALKADKIIQQRNLQGAIIGQLYIMMAEIYCYEHNDLESALEYYKKSVLRISSNKEVSEKLRKMIKNIEKQL